MFRFSTRDVLWLTVVVALAVGWWLDRRSHTAAVQQLHRKLDDLTVQALTGRAYEVQAERLAELLALERAEADKLRLQSK